MKNELIVKKCNHCGALVKVIKDCNCNGCGIVCCDEPMQVMVPNSVDAAVEKHIPTYEVSGDEIIVKVNHVMDKEHYKKETGKIFDLHFKSEFENFCLVF